MILNTDRLQFAFRSGNILGFYIFSTIIIFFFLKNHIFGGLSVYTFSIFLFALSLSVWFSRDSLCRTCPRYLQSSDYKCVALTWTVCVRLSSKYASVEIISLLLHVVVYFSFLSRCVIRVKYFTSYLINFDYCLLIWSHVQPKPESFSRDAGFRIYFVDTKFWRNTRVWHLNVWEKSWNWILIVFILIIYRIKYLRTEKNGFFNVFMCFFLF